MSESKPHRLVSVAAAAGYAGVHPQTIRLWYRTSRIPACRLGPRLIRIDLDDIDALIEARR